MTKKTLFDHITHITTINDSNYFKTLSDMDKKTYSIYMINRFLSINSDWVVYVNEIQKYTQQLKENGIHIVYNEIIPKKKVYLKYIKSSKNKKYNDDILNILKKEYELGSNQVKAYYDIFFKDEKSKAKLLELLIKYGTQEQEFKKIKKEINAN